MKQTRGRLCYYCSLPQPEPCADELITAMATKVFLDYSRPLTPIPQVPLLVRHIVMKIPTS